MYDDDSCHPPPTKTYLTIGQDLFSIESYLREQYNYSLHRYIQEHNNQSNTLMRHRRRRRNRRPPVLADIMPAAFMVYTDLQTLRGLDRPTDYGSGIEFADGLLQLLSSSSHPKLYPVALQIGLWLNGSQGCSDVVNGQLNHQLLRLHHYLANCHANKVFLRVGYEFDNPSFGYDNATLFQQCFQTIVRGCQQHSVHCRSKTVFVWHSWASSLTSFEELDAYYPGDDVVDWIGISLFSQLYSVNQSQVGNRNTVDLVLEFAQQHHKPTMIAESTPFGGIPNLRDPWKDWFEPVLELIQQYDVHMWSYINCDWESQPMWHGIGFGDTRLDINATILQLWHDRVLNNPRFISSSNLHRRSPCASHQEQQQLAKHDTMPEGTFLDRVSYLHHPTSSSYYCFSDANNNSVLSPWYLYPVVFIALVAVCARVWCSPSSSRRAATNDSTSNSGESMYLSDETNSQFVEDDNGVMEPNRSGYGTL